MQRLQQVNCFNYGQKLFLFLRTTCLYHVAEESQILGVPICLECDQVSFNKGAQHFTFFKVSKSNNKLEDSPNKSSLQSETDLSSRTPSPVFRGRRELNDVDTWRYLQGTTPKEDDPKRGSINWNVVNYFIHKLAEEKNIDLKAVPLPSAFFEEFVQRYGNVSGGARFGNFKSPLYIQKVWRRDFCEKVEKNSGLKQAGTHKYEPPQEAKHLCSYCNNSPREQQPKDSVPDLLADQVSDGSEEKSEEGTLKKTNSLDGGLKCLECGKTFKTRKTRTTHIKKFHPGAVKPEVSDRKEQCQLCMKIVGNLPLHQASCRGVLENLAKCLYCKGKFPKARIAQHISGRIEKKTGKVSVLSCEERQKQMKNSNDRGNCSVCGKIMLITTIPVHMRKAHPIIKLCTTTLGPSESVKDQGTEQVKKKTIALSRQQLAEAIGNALFQLNMSKAKEESLKDEQCLERQHQMVQRGVVYAKQAFSLQLLPAGTLIPMDGDCIFSSVAYGRDPTLSGDLLRQAATVLRQNAVGHAINLIDGLTEESFGGLQAAAAAGTNVSREEVKSAMERYMHNGQYEGNLGDLLPQFVSSYLGVPLLIIEVNVGAYWVNPGHVFRQPVNSDVPLVLVRQAEHFEVLQVKHCGTKNDLHEMNSLCKILKHIICFDILLTYIIIKKPQ